MRKSWNTLITEEQVMEIAHRLLGCPTTSTQDWLWEHAKEMVYESLEAGDTIEHMMETLDEGYIKCENCEHEWTNWYD